MLNNNRVRNQQKRERKKKKEGGGRKGGKRGNQRKKLKAQENGHEIQQTFDNVTTARARTPYKIFGVKRAFSRTSCSALETVNAADGTARAEPELKPDHEKTTFLIAL